VARGSATGKRIEGTITGGTGRYADVEGDFVFDWQYVLHLDDGTVQGRALNLSGRFRRRPAAPTVAPEGEGR